MPDSTSSTPSAHRKLNRSYAEPRVATGAYYVSPLGVEPLQLDPHENGSRFEFHADPGLYQLSIIADARDFDWERCYVDLHEFNNHGERTGPWDFELHTNRPLIPAYWVWLDGVRLGMWFFQRFALADIEKRVVRGRTAFQISKQGRHELRLIPFRKTKVRWLSVRLEPDPEDQLQPLPSSLRNPAGKIPESRWIDDDFWVAQKQRLRSERGSAWQTPLRDAITWASQRDQSPNGKVDGRALPTFDIPLLVAGERLGWAAGGVQRSLELIDAAVALPYWGKAPDGAYGHNGDMSASLMLRALAWSLHILRADELGQVRRERLLEKLRFQGNRFVEQALLTRDYWGGSLRQDHGWRSIWTFSTAALLMHGMVPDAEHWLGWCLPRMRRSLRAMSRDGIIPPSSHECLFLYLDELAVCRHTLLGVADIDLYEFERESIKKIVPYVLDVFHPDSNTLLQSRPSTETAPIGIIGGLPFFGQMAEWMKDQLSAWFLQQQLGKTYEADRDVAYMSHTVFWSFFTAGEGVVSAAKPEPAPRSLTHYSDDGRVVFRDRAKDLSFYLRCGPNNGAHAYFHASGPCDRVETSAIAGHFTFYVGATPILATAPPGYRIQSNAGSILLIDGQGQIGDGTYPMSIPSWEHPGHFIERVDGGPDSGRVRMNLRDAYPAETGLLEYVREIIIHPDGRLTCRDSVVLQRPGCLAWLFQFDRAVGASLEKNGPGCIIGSERKFLLGPGATPVDLRVSLHKTNVVHSYSSAWHEYGHARYESVEPLTSATVDFDLVEIFGSNSH